MRKKLLVALLASAMIIPMGNYNMSVANAAQEEETGCEEGVLDDDTDLVDQTIYVTLSEKNFPDDEFRSELQKRFDLYNPDNVLDVREIKELSISVSGISDYYGLKYLWNLQELKLANVGLYEVMSDCNNMAALDVTANSKIGCYSYDYQELSADTLADMSSCKLDMSKCKDFDGSKILAIRGANVDGNKLIVNSDGIATGKIQYEYSCRNGQSMSVVINGVKELKLSTPKLSAVSNVEDGVKFTWKKVANAKLYAIYRKTGTSSWKLVGKSTEASYVDKTAKSGTNYTYTVRCLASDDETTKISGYDKNGLSITYIAMPKLNTISQTKTGIKVTWDSVEGAELYGVYRKNDGSSWKLVGTTANVSFTDKSAVKGATYTYTVRCLTADKVKVSAYDTIGLTIEYK